MKNIKLYFVLLILFLGFGCLDEIDFDRPDSIKNGIAIQGKLVKADSSEIIITVRKVFDFFENPRLISVKEVKVISDKGGEMILTTKVTGIYKQQIPNNLPNFSLDYGNGFKVVVTTFDNRIFESTIEKLLPVPKAPQLTKKLDLIEAVDAVGTITLREFLTFGITTSLKVPGVAENARLLWEIEGMYKIKDSPLAYTRQLCLPTVREEAAKTCYAVFSPVKNYQSIDGTLLNSDKIEDYPLINFSPSYVFAEGTYINVFQQSLSPSAFDYWNQVSLLVNRTGGIFQEPAGKIITNFKNINDPNDEVFGYFYVTEQVVARVYVSPEFANNPGVLCPIPVQPGGAAPSGCCNCLEIDGAQREKPIWWKE